MNEPVKLKIGAAEIPLPRWVLGPLGVLVIVAALGGGGWFAWEHVQGDRTRISAADLVQLEHSSRHLTETPAAVLPVFDDARGRMLVKFYASDSCTLVERHTPAGPVVSRFMLNLDVQAPLRAARHIAARDPWSSSPAVAQGRCYAGPAEHPGESTATNEGLDACNVKAWRSWADGCKGYAVWNGCASVWGPWTWTACVH